MNDIEAIEHLEQSGNYRIIKRLQAVGRYRDGEPATPRIGLVIDTETTGLDTAGDRIIELGFVAFEYDASTGAIYRTLHTYDGFEDPGEPLTEIVRQITGITDEMLKGEKLDSDEIMAWFEKADIVIAHNAAFDRQMIERRLPATGKSSWGCTLNDINWQSENILSRKLDYIACMLGFFFDGHRAVNDAQATLHLLTRTLPESGRPVMSELLLRAREKRRRFFALHAPFDRKDELKAHGYQWLPAYSYSDRSGKPKKGVWSISVGEADIEAEQQWLVENIYNGREGRFTSRDITAAERYSLREFQAG
ncbi:MAG: 3'-5' exonuclease [Mariprofundaceae bacterium]|nr:3'-5' exonuclease [Mariprofundaceae bacterium]